MKHNKSTIKETHDAAFGPSTVIKTIPVQATLTSSPCFQQMNSLGSSSKWPSYDSLPSTSSFPHSESEHTEDETDAFSEGEVDSGVSKSISAHERLSLPACYLQLAPFHPLTSRTEEPSSQWPDRAQPVVAVSSPSTSTFSSSPVTPGDMIFAQKVSTL